MVSGWQSKVAPIGPPNGNDGRENAPQGPPMELALEKITGCSFEQRTMTGNRHST